MKSLNCLQVSQCETSAKGGAKRHVTSLLAQETTIAESLPGVALVQHQAMGQSQRHETLSKSSRRDSLALNNRSKPQLKRKA